MKRIYLFLLFAGLLGWAEKAIAQEAVTIEQCYGWARDNYPLINQYGLIERAERYNLSNAGKAWLPQVSMNAKATYQSEVTVLPFEVDKIASFLPGFSMPTLSKDQYQVAVQVDQTIWDGGATRTVKTLSRAEAKVSRKQLESDLYALNDRVNQLFFGSLLQNELIRQNELLQNELRINRDRIATLIQNGVANQSDLESMEVELLNARQKEIELKASRSAYRQMLSTLINKPLSDQQVLRVPILPDAPLSANIQRPELEVLNARSALTSVQDQQITASLMPRFGAFVQGGYGRPGLNMLDNDFSSFYMAGVRMSWNLGKLYSLKNDRRKVDVNRRNVEVQRETFLFNTRLQLLQQHAEIRKMTDLAQADNEIIRLRTSIKKAAEVKLENGVISVTDLIREINAEDLAKQTAAIRHIQRLMMIYDYMYTTN